MCLSKRLYLNNHWYLQQPNGLKNKEKGGMISFCSNDKPKGHMKLNFLSIHTNVMVLKHLIIFKVAS
jgi:hypothetical protein